MPILKYHYLLNQIMCFIDYSHIDSLINSHNKGRFNSTFPHPGYTEDTIFEGYGSDKKWFSLNFIEGSDCLYLHTNLKLQNNTPQKIKNFVTNKYQNFSKKALLFEIGKINTANPWLYIADINQILQNLQ